MKFISLCSGIDAASVAFNPLGWEAIAFSEIDATPSSVLAHHYPSVPNLGDMTQYKNWPEQIFIDADAIVGGPPCQAFSVAGTRASLDDDRGNLTLIYTELIDHADRIRISHGRPAVVCLYENVPGLLSVRDNAFGCFLAQLCGGDEPLNAPDGWPDAGCVSGPSRTAAWRILDAQYFGLAQRRRRVFVVGSARNGFDPAAVLFEFDGLRRDSAPRREVGKGTAHDLAPSLTASGRGVERAGDTRGQDPVVAVRTLCVATGQGGAEIGAEIAPTLNCNHEAPYAFCASKLHNTTSNNAGKIFYERTACLDANSPPPALLTAMSIRRLTPRECERLQGFPDDYSLIPGRRKKINPEKLDHDYIKYLARGGVMSLEQCQTAIADGPRYKMLGNSWAVPCAAWIGRRMAAELGKKSA